MKKLFFIVMILDLYSCSSEVEEKNNTPAADTQNVVNVPPSADTASCPSAGLRRFVSEAAKIGFTPTDTGVYFLSAQKEFFGLANVNNTFSPLETGILSRTKNACLKLQKKIDDKQVVVEVEEWTFSGLSEARMIENALYAPLKNKAELRFVETPFTTWRVYQRMYHIRTSGEKYRREMEKLNELLVSCVAPAQ